MYNYVGGKVMKKVLFISNTGGHLSELLQLKPMFKDYDYHIITERTKSTLALYKEYGEKIDYLTYTTKDHLFSHFFKFIKNIFRSIYLYIMIRPKYIVTTGTHTAIPMCYIGKLFRCKIVFIETFENINTRTLSGRLIYPISNLFIVQWKEMLKLYPKAVYAGWIY